MTQPEIPSFSGQTGKLHLHAPPSPALSGTQRQVHQLVRLRRQLPRAVPYCLRAALRMASQSNSHICVVSKHAHCSACPRRQLRSAILTPIRNAVSSLLDAVFRYCPPPASVVLANFWRTAGRRLENAHEAAGHSVDLKETSRSPPWSSWWSPPCGLRRRSAARQLPAWQHGIGPEPQMVPLLS